jgi:SAM-dependent methyltransferase
MSHDEAMSEPHSSSELRLDELFTTSFQKLPPARLFPELPLPIWTEAFFRANELVNLYTDYSVWSVLRAMGAEPGQPLWGGAAELERLGVAPERLSSASWLLAKAARSVFAAGAAVAPGPPAELSLGELAEDFGTRLAAAILAENAALEPSLRLIDAAAGGYPGFLRGEAEGREVLFAPRILELWELYFDNRNPLYGPMNRLAAFAAREALEKGAAAGRRGSWRLLEVGAGCGSGSECLFEELGSGAARLAITDISPNFLRKARERLRALAGLEEAKLEFRLLDLNRPAAAWGLDGASFDLVFAVNVLHSIRDLVGTLRDLRGLLAPGGALVLGECIRPARGQPVHPEFIFQLLEEFRSVLLHPLYRPEWGFLDAASWRAALAEAGFARARLLPEVENVVAGYAEYSIAALVAES